MDSETTLLKRKEIVLQKLSAYGITDVVISYMPYLDCSAQEYQNPRDVGYRLLILWGLSYLASNLDKKDDVEGWFKTEGLWEHVSERERRIFVEELSQQTLVDLSWGIEAALVLAWAVNLVNQLPDLNIGMSEDVFDEFEGKLPIGENPEEFVSSLKYRDEEEIFIENSINELVTTHLRDQYFNGTRSSSDINSKTSFERHKSLNWLRKFSGIDEWDETDTST
jgi:hypothetical protein